MLNKIIFTILGFGLAFVFFPHPAKDSTRTPVISGIETEAQTNIALAAPELSANLPPPEISAKSALAIDLDSGLLLYSKNLYEKLPIASLTKLMTALVVVDQTDPNAIVTVDNNDINIVGTSIGLSWGEKITVGELLKAMLIPSSNDAALLLSKFVAKDENSFVGLMNKKAQELGLANTHFSNPVGWDSDDNYSDTLDLVKVVKEFIKHDDLTKIVKTKQTSISSVDGKYIHELTTTNKLLLNNSEVVGIKTGFTSKALGNLIIMADHNDRKIVTIVLDSNNREADSQELLDWLFKSYKW